MHLTITYTLFGETRSLIVPSSGLTVGSSPRCDLTVRDPLIEPMHARIFAQLGTWWVEPASAAAIIALGRTRVRDVTPLKPSDTLRLGPIKLRLDFSTRHADTHVDVGESIPSPLAVDVQAPGPREDERIALLHTIRRAARGQSPRSLLAGALPAILSCFPSASAIAVLEHADRELVPIANHPEGPPVVSFTLARRAARSRQAMVWERHVGAGESRDAASLVDVSSAIYCPMVEEDELVGLLALTCSSRARQLSAADVPMAIELARILTSVVRRGEKDGSRPPTTFLSYSHADKALALELAGFLRRQRISVWMDDRLVVGTDWRAALADAIRTSDAFTLLISKDSLRSKTVRWERRQATQAGKPLLPVLLNGKEHLPRSLQALQYVELAHGDDARHRLADRIRAVSRRR